MFTRVYRICEDDTSWMELWGEGEDMNRDQISTRLSSTAVVTTTFPPLLTSMNAPATYADNSTFSIGMDPLRIVGLNESL